MMKALAKSFKCPEDSAFFGSFDILNVPEIPDRDRVQLVTYEIWRATGYRFTIKDHPQTKTGHTTRFWCSQDVHRKYRQTLNVVSRMIKNRFPCRSRLLVSSRDTETPGYRRVTMRMYHRFPHEPYTETQRIWPVGSSLGPSPSWMGSVEEEDRVRVATNAVHPHSYTPRPILSPIEFGQESRIDPDGVSRAGQQMYAEQVFKNPGIAPSHSTTSSTSMLKLASTSPSVLSASLFGSSSMNHIPVPSLVSLYSIYPVYPNHPIHANPLVTIGQLQSNLMTPTSDPGLAYFNQISHSNPGNLTSFPSPSPGPPTVASASGLTSVSASASASPVLPISTETFQRKMHTYIRNIRDFCDGLEYQLQFNDLRMLQELEEKGNGFLEYVKTCLEREGRLKSDQSQDETGA
ncbi:uncharacterized protein C8R40DRAFT_611123 [Lentinula edodes]|uniref:uncharacterized protein n=1 Tax=Lentinula edodes TaxID=5353 RepID=UPI001E8CFA24|nr:uncharacterized protein C8R40DRAFT_611123 [Lentinula edodes]KAH7871067.1 hypothetical protein C8R40DRAFT_611123 [Lentinula edodes]